MNRFLIWALLAALTAGPGWSRILSYTAFRNSAQVDADLATLASTYPSLARIETIGNSLGGLPIKALKISTTPAVNDPAKGDVVYFALHHAREWIAVEMAIFLADELLARFATDPELNADMSRLQIWIVPVVNPDGYLYSQTTDRFWRKNRRDNGDGTFGVDLNRNWGYQWGLLSGSSATTSNDTYHGSGAFSEPETVVMRDFLQSRGNLKAMLTYHSYSELYLKPWSYTTANAPGFETLKSVNDRDIARVAAVAGEVYGTTIGYTSAGEATDWVWNQFRIAAFTPELRPNSAGLGGFDPLPATILPSNQENLESALALVHDAARTGVWIKDWAGDTGQEPSATWTGTGWSNPFWESPDISTTPALLSQGATVTLHVTVHNDTGVTQNNVRVDVYYTDPRISLEFPNPNAILIGTVTQNLPPGDTVIDLPWNVPVGTNSWGELHWCVGVVIKHDRDMPLSTQVQKSSNVGCRNFNTQPLVISGALTVMVAAENFLRIPAESLVLIDRASLPPGWKVVVGLPPPLPKEVDWPLTATQRKARLLGVTGPLLEPGQVMLVPIRIEAPPGVPAGTEVDIRVHGGIRPLVAGKRDTLGNGFTYHIVTR